MKNDVMWSSSKMDWSTPQDFFDKLNEEFRFTLDSCADGLNHKCDKYYTVEQDGLKQIGRERVYSAILLMVEMCRSGCESASMRCIRENASVL